MASDARVPGPVIGGGRVPDATAGRPWGFWTTAGFGLAVFAVFIMVQIVIGIPFFLWLKAENPAMSEEQVLKFLEYNGFFLSVATIATGIVCPALIVLFAWGRC